MKIGLRDGLIDICTQFAVASFLSILGFVEFFQTFEERLHSFTSSRFPNLELSEPYRVHVSCTRAFSGRNEETGVSKAKEDDTVS